MAISILIGDIALQHVDVIVNSANPSLLAGGGVCGAIHKAAGPELEVACKAIGRCSAGSAVITPGFNLPAKFVIHAVGPRWLDGRRGEPELLEQCYESIFRLVTKNDCRSVAMPSISTGIYHYPLAAAVDVAVEVAKKFDNDSLQVIFACFDDVTLRAYQLRLQRHLR